jgi:hypothetical protein
VNVSGDDLLAQYERARQLWPFLRDVEAEFDLPAFLLFAVGSKETGLRPEYADGKVHGDGHGWGLFGADDRWNELDLPAFASDPRAQARLGGATLSANHQRHANWLDAVNAYGPAAGRPAYGKDVLDRAAYLRQHVGGSSPMTPVEIIWAATADLEAAGYKVSYVDDWDIRGRPGTFAPQGLVCHHTATSRRAAGDYPSLGIVTDGRPDLPGPLAQFGLGRSGRVYVVAGGKANHAGPGGWRELAGNATVWGIEAENDGIGEPWPAEQIDAYLSLAAALARHTGFGPEMVCAHREWTPEKIDPAGIDMPWFRDRVAERLAGAPPPPDPPPEDDMAKSAYTLFNWGGAVWAWPGGDPLPLFLWAQVEPYLNDGAITIGDLADEQFRAIAPTYSEIHPPQSEGLNRAMEAVRAAAVPPPAEPLGCAAADG